MQVVLESQSMRETGKFNVSNERSMCTERARRRCVDDDFQMFSLVAKLEEL